LGQILHRNRYHPILEYLSVLYSQEVLKNKHARAYTHTHTFHGSVSVSQRQQASLTSHEKFQERLAVNQDISMALQEGKYSILPLWQARI